MQICYRPLPIVAIMQILKPSSFIIRCSGLMQLSSPLASSNSLICWAAFSKIIYISNRQKYVVLAKDDNVYDEKERCDNLNNC